MHSKMMRPGSHDEEAAADDVENERAESGAKNFTVVKKERTLVPSTIR